MTLIIIEDVTISTKYADFINLFSKELTKRLQEQIGINKHVIKLENIKRLFY